MVPGAQEHGSWFMVHGAWCLDPGAQTTERCPIQVPRSSWSCCSDHLEPWIMDHGAIPWVLLALDPGAQDPWIMLPWFMVHEPIPWVLIALDPGTWCPGSWIMDHAPWYILRSSEQESFLTQSTTRKSLQNNQKRRTLQFNTTGIVQVNTQIVTARVIHQL